MNEEKETSVKTTKPKGSSYTPQEKEPTPVTTYEKSQLVAATRFAATDRDILAVVLGEEKKYTLDEAEDALQAFKNREVR
ncbi:MAG: hypothetical protein ABS894_00620 [Aerococcus urinaeequi]